MASMRPAGGLSTLTIVTESSQQGRSVTRTMTLTYAASAIMEAQSRAILRRAGLDEDVVDRLAIAVRNRWVNEIGVFVVDQPGRRVAELSLRYDSLDDTKLTVHDRSVLEEQIPNETLEPPFNEMSALADKFTELARRNNMQISYWIRFAKVVQQDESLRERLSGELGVSHAVPLSPWLTVEYLPEVSIRLSTDAAVASRTPDATPVATSRSSFQHDAAPSQARQANSNQPRSDVRSALELDIYLDTEDADLAERVFVVADALAELLGFEHPTETERLSGSIFRRAKARAQRALTSDELRERLVKVERAIEIAQLDMRQAEVDDREAKAASQLIAALENVPNACLRLGSILLIKYQEDSGATVLVTRNLSQAELVILEKFPEIQTNPRTALSGLAAAVATVGQGALKRLTSDS